jgi:PAS domain S-box-containing protein
VALPNVLEFLSSLNLKFQLETERECQHLSSRGFRLAGEIGIISNRLMALAMITFPGYQIFAQIDESARAAIYRGIRERDNQPVILKVLKSEYPTPLELERYQQEYEILQNLDVEGVVRVYGLESYQRTVGLILEDFGGRALSDLMRDRSVAGGEISLREFLQLAIEIVAIIGRIHGAGAIHKDVNLANIGLNPETGELKMFDFSISTLLDWENLNPEHPTDLQGTLAYISPEQTGRTNRSLDYRTDFYSLGVTFYQLLSGRLPFQTTDLLEMVHFHLAKQPPSLESEGAIPRAIADVVMKMMAKNPEDRYQSAWGIHADLVKGLQQLETQGKIDRFVLGSEDFCDRFSFPQKLYGRETEIKTILDAFDRLACPLEKHIAFLQNQEIETSRHLADIILISGNFGLGKSALLQDVFNQLSLSKRCSCLFIKCDPVRVNVPYSTTIDILRSLARQLLTESKTRIDRCRQKLFALMAENLEAISADIPELKAILESPEPNLISEDFELPDYNRVFPILFQVLGKTEYPLVIFVDDWQWVDAASLKPIESLMLSSKLLKFDEDLTDNFSTESRPSKNINQSIFDDLYEAQNEADGRVLQVLWVNTYQESEETRELPVKTFLKEIERAGSIVDRISLSPLNTDAISKCLADILHRDTRAVRALAKVVAQKTGGNPFFIREFLKNLYANSVIYFDSDSRSWKWDLTQIEATDLTDNLVDLTIANFKKLPLKTQQILGGAACIGIDFDLNTLSAISKYSSSEIYQHLLPALKSELIFPISNLDNLCLGSDSRAYKFGHDRIHKLAYDSIEEPNKLVTHLEIGRFWLHQKFSKEWIDRHIFKIANQLYLGSDGISLKKEREEVARLHLKAAQKAKLSMNLETALDYLDRGLTVSGANQNSQVVMELQQEISELVSLQSFFEQSDTIFNLSVEFFAQGKNLEDLKRDIARYLSLADRHQKFNETLGYIQVLQEELEKFTGKPIDEYVSATDPDRSFGYASFKASTLLSKYQVFKCQLYYFEDRPDEALNMARSVSRSIDYVLSAPLTIAYLFYYSLTLLKLYPVASELKRQTFWKQIELNQNQMQLWLDRYPEEVNHKVLLIEAEIHRLSERFLEAMERYDRAIDLARDNQSIHEEALAYELAAQFYITWGKTRIAQTYLKEAHYTYSRWGATAKVRSLEVKYPKLLKALFPKDVPEPYEPLVQIGTTTESPGSSLDLATVMKASRAISREICLDRFLSKSIEILIENAGAQRGFLILPSRSLEDEIGELYIVAQSSVEGATCVLQSTSLDWIQPDSELPLVSSAIVNYVVRTQESVVLNCAFKEGNFTPDFYIQKAQVQSVLCDPLLYQGKLVGVVYLENNLTTGAFTPERLQVIRMLSQQAAIALENARLYERLEEYSHTLEARVERRTTELQQEIRERQLLENKLRSEESKMRAIFEGMTDIILIVKVANDRIENIDIAPTYPTCISAPGQELVNRTVDGFFEDNSNWQTLVRQVLATQQTQNFDYCLLLDETPIWFTASISPIPGGSVIWVARNITERVLAEEALRLSEETFSKSFSASPSAIAITHMGDGRHIEVNETFCTLTGYTPEEVIGRTALDLNLWVNSEDRQNLFQLIQHEGIVRNYEFDFRTKSGTILTALLSVEIVRIRGEECLLAISNDITERKKAEQELHHKNEELAHTLQQLQATQDELIQSERMASLGQLIAGVAHEINTPMGAIRASIDNISKSLHSALQELPQLFQKLSPERLADFLALLEFDRQSSQILSFREERKIKRSLRNELESRGIDNADTLAATLVSLGITNDLEWLIPILQDSECDSILDTAENLSILQKNSENIKLAVERASKIVFALKTYSRHNNSGQMTKFLITEGIDLVLTIYQNQLKRGIEVIKKYDEIPFIYCFSEELNQVWTNLIHNSIHAMNDRGILKISACQKDDFILVKVTDSGCGISPEIQHKIFDPFFTTKPSGEGSGLGLNIVYKIIERHRGKIEVESQPGCTTFSIWLPIGLQ